MTESVYQWIRNRAFNDSTLRQAITQAVRDGRLADSEAHTYYTDISREMKEQPPAFTLGESF